MGMTVRVQVREKGGGEGGGKKAGRPEGPSESGRAGLGEGERAEEGRRPAVDCGPARRGGLTRARRSKRGEGTRSRQRVGARRSEMIKSGRESEGEIERGAGGKQRLAGWLSDGPAAAETSAGSRRARFLRKSEHASARDPPESVGGRAQRARAKGEGTNPGGGKEHGRASSLAGWPESADGGNDGGDWAGP